MTFDKLFKLIRDLGYTSGTHTEAITRAVMAAYDTSQVELPADRQMRLYLAGPMTGIEDYNFPAFNAAAKLLRDVSFQVINPAEHGIVPGAEWADYMRYDIAKLVTCHTIALLPGWEKSKGACWEVEIAQRLGMQVLALEGAVYPTEAAAMAATVPADLLEMEARKDAAYLERNQVVAALAKCFPSGTARTAIEGWSEDWHGCVYIDLPTGQASWHYHDSHAYLFADLQRYPGAWDGHDTPEKYARLARLTQAPVADQPAEPSPADMLDWLDETNKRFKMGWEVGAAPAGNVSVRTIIMGGKPIREAIRAAMPAPKGDSNG